MSAHLPETFDYGKVVGRFLLAVADAQDENRLPDAVPPTGGISFTPLLPNMVVLGAEPTTVVKTPIRCTVGPTGELIDPQDSTGVWLVCGTYKVAYSLNNVTIRSHDIVVLPEHSEENPLDLATALPPVSGPPITPSQYAELSARISALAGSGLDVSELQDVLLTMFSPQNDINIYQMDPPNEAFIAFDVLGMDAIRADVEALEESIATLEASIGGSIDHTDISDWQEAVQDALASFFSVSAGSITYDDPGNRIIINLPPPDGNTTDPEAVRDAIGAALIGLGNINVSVNDAADTITITTIATVNSSDAALRARASHTGVQPIASIDGLVDYIDDTIEAAIGGAGGSGVQTIIAKTGAFTIDATMVGQLVTVNVLSGVTISVPTDAALPGFPIGGRVDILVINTGMPTVAAVTPGTTTVNGSPSLVARAQWSGLTIIKRAANVWTVVGDLA